MEDQLQLRSDMEAIVAKSKIFSSTIVHPATPVVEPATPVVESATPVVEPATPVVEPSPPVVTVTLPPTVDIVAKLVNSGKTINYEGHKVLIVNTPILEEEVGSYGNDRGFVFVICYNIRSDSKINVNFYANNFDVSKEVKRYGGSGHNLTMHSIEDFNREFFNRK